MNLDSSHPELSRNGNLIVSYAIMLEIRLLGYLPVEHTFIILGVFL